MRGRELQRVLACATLAVVWSVPVVMHALCSTDACVPGGGSTASDCAFEWLVTPPPPLAGTGLPSRKPVCYEGDPLCDADPDIGNHLCVFPLTLCINNGDARLADCTPSNLAAFEVHKPSARHLRDSADAANLDALENGVNQDFAVTVLRNGNPFLIGGPNADPDACGSVLSIEVPLRVQRSGRLKRGRRTLRVVSLALDGRRDADSLKLECRPSTCGNGIVEPHEDCDDGNRLNGDGCDQGCRFEAPTPTPTATLPTPTASDTATVTLTPSITATASATATATGAPPTATRTATDTALPATATATASTTRTATSTATATDTATVPPTATSTPTATETATPTPTATPPPMTVGITAFRPQSETYGSPFQRRAVPTGENVTPGVGVRVNRDDDNNNGIDDYLDTSVSGENDLVELTLQVNPFPAPAGYEYVLQRSNGDVKVWNSSTKGGAALLDANDEAVIAFGSASRTVWVERLDVGDTMLTLLARPAGGGGTIVSSDVRLFAFTSVIIALGGENQSPSDPPDPNHGMFNIASTLYGMGYDVHMYDEDEVNSSGLGAAYDEVIRAVSRRRIGIVSIYGYSHGGGSTHDLADRLNTDRASIGTFTMPYTAYVDAIRNSSDIDIRSETRLPPSTAYHVNYYQRNDLFIRGDSVSGADVDVNVTSTPWGSGLDHGAIDDHPNVRDGVLQPLLARVPR